MKYTLNYHTGAGNEEFDTIENAMQNASPAYTQQDITIDDQDGNRVMMMRWWGYDPDVAREEDPDVEIAFEIGSSGFYTAWQDA